MQRGDIAQLGQHRLMCGDAFSEDDRAALLQGEKPDMLYCDPPYGIGKTRADKRTRNWWRDRTGEKKYRTTRPYRLVEGDAQEFEPDALFTALAHVPEQFWWGADYYAHAIPERNNGAWIVWDKRGSEQQDKGVGSCFELCWSRKSHKRLVARIPWAGFIGVQNEPDKKRHHPTQKPVALAEWFLDRYSKPDALILDLFGGSGSTLLACERMGRRGHLMELSPDYCDVIIERYERMTQQGRLIA